MSRIGKKPVPILSGVKVVPTRSDEGTLLNVEGPKGKLSFQFRKQVSLSIEDGKVVVTRGGEEAFDRAYHGTARALIANMIQGVHRGFERGLSIVGVGYNAKIQGKKLVLAIGFSHPVEMEIPAGLTLETPTPTNIVVKGADKQLVGEFASRIRRVRPPEPYKGKGIRYVDEVVVRKAGKSFGSAE